MASYYPAYPTIALLSSVLVLVPLPWHFEALNMGTCLYMVWSSLACLTFGVNAVVWRSDAINRAPIWCDISSRVIVAAAVALPASSVCILRRLHGIITAQTLSTSASRRKDAYVDLSIGVGLPFFQLIMQYIVSGHRFDIYEEVGCYPFTYNTPLAYPLSIVWPIFIGLVSGVYSVLTLRGLLRRRAQLSEFLSSTSSLTAQRYLRLMAIAMVEILCTVPISSYGLWLNIRRTEIRPWISWSDTHFNYSKVDLLPSVLWRANHLTTIGIELTRWLPVFCALVFFGLFGFAEEARKHYRQAFERVVQFLRLQRHVPRSDVLPLTGRGFHNHPYPKRRARAHIDSLLWSNTSMSDNRSKCGSFDLSIYEDASSTSTLTALPSPSSTSTLISAPEKAHIC